MTFTTSDLRSVSIGVVMATVVAILVVIVCNVPPKPATAIKTKVATTSPDAVIPEPPVQPSPSEQRAAPAISKPFYGNSYYDELLTSVYYYPQGGNGEDTPNEVATHLKFNHREDDVWLCGDQRKSFTPGKRVRLTITFEPNRVCATNWQIL